MREIVPFIMTGVSIVSPLLIVRDRWWLHSMFPGSIAKRRLFMNFGLLVAAELVALNVIVTEGISTLFWGNGWRWYWPVVAVHSVAAMYAFAWLWPIAKAHYLVVHSSGQLEYWNNSQVIDFVRCFVAHWRTCTVTLVRGRAQLQVKAEYRNAVATKSIVPLDGMDEALQLTYQAFFDRYVILTHAHRIQRVIVSRIDERVTVRYEL